MFWCLWFVPRDFFHEESWASMLNGRAKARYECCPSGMELIIMPRSSFETLSGLLTEAIDFGS